MTDESSPTSDAAPLPGPPPTPEAPRPTPTDHRDRHWIRRITIFAILLVAAVILFAVGAAFLPRWWAHRIGDQVGQSTASGIGIGLFYGSVFTFLPLLVLWFGFRKRRSWKAWLGILVGASVLAIPNLLTLGIVAGSGNAAHAGERTLDVEAPYFRASTLIGVIAAAVIFAVLLYILWMRRRGKRTERHLRDELRARDAAAAAAAQTEKPSE
jgi:Kef-type K+ transport system membrane component KefB